MRIYRPDDVFSGFHAEAPCAELPELLYTAEVWRHEKWRVGRHQHPDHWEVKFQAAGEARWIMDGEPVHLSAGDLLILPPATPHELAGSNGERQHLIFIGLRPEAVFGRIPDLEASWASAAAGCKVAEAEAVRVPFRLLIREVRCDRTHRPDAIRAAFDLLVIEIGRLAVASAKWELLPGHPAVADACRLMESHCEKPWPLRQLGRFVGLSPNHLATLFQRELGMTPHDFLLQSRVARAQELLGTTDMTVTDIAMEVGFSSSQHFARVFRKLEGCTASTYRRRPAKSPG